MEQNKPAKQENLPHNLELKSRNILNISGVLEMISATGTLISMKTSAGNLNITGSEMKVKNLNNNQHEVEIEGKINEIKYDVKKRNF